MDNINTPQKTSLRLKPYKELRILRGDKWEPVGAARDTADFNTIGDRFDVGEIVVYREGFEYFDIGNALRLRVVLVSPGKEDKIISERDFIIDKIEGCTIETDNLMAIRNLGLMVDFTPKMWK